MLPRYYPILDAVTLARLGLPIVAAAEGLLEGGARLLQLREKGPLTRDGFTRAQTVAALCRDAGATLIVNDRADLAMLLDAGLHVGQEDLPPAVVRPMLGSRLIGYSTHNAGQLAEGDLQPVDYLAIGPIFGTVSKENPDPVVGLEALAACRRLTAKPLVAIGGVHRESARSLLAAGADTLAVIGDAYPAAATKQAVRERTMEWVALLGA